MAHPANPTPTAPTPRTDPGEFVQRLAEIGERDELASAKARRILSLLAAFAGGRGALLFATDSEAPPQLSEYVFDDEAESARDEIVRTATACAAQVATQGRALVNQLAGVAGGLVIVTAPVASGSGTRQVVCLLARQDRRQPADALLLVAQTTAQAFHAQDLRLGLRRATALVELFSRVEKADDFPNAAHALAEELAEFLGCHRVCIGIARTAGIRLAAVSGDRAFDRRSARSLAIERAMSAAKRRGETLRDGPALDEMCRVLGASHAMSAPLGDVGAWLCVWKEAPDSAALAFLESSAPHVATFLQLARRGKPGKFLGPIERGWREASRDKRRLVVALGAALALLLVWPFPYRIAADAKLQPVTRRIVAAPFEGVLKQSFVEPGEIVRRGDPLAELEGKEIRWQLAEAAADRARALKERDAAMAKGDAAAAQIAQLEAAALGEKVNLLEYRRDNLVIASPIDGAILAGDLKRAQGVPLVIGQRLFEVAPLEGMIMEIEVPEREISRVRVGMETALRLESQPGETWRAPIDRIHPRSEQIDGKNVFLCEADLERTDGALRPGMRGEAKIQGPRRPLIWIALHRLWEWFQLHVW